MLREMIEMKRLLLSVALLWWRPRKSRVCNKVKRWQRRLQSAFCDVRHIACATVALGW